MYIIEQGSFYDILGPDEFLDDEDDSEYDYDNYDPDDYSSTGESISEMLYLEGGPDDEDIEEWDEQQAEEEEDAASFEALWFYENYGK